MTWDFERGVLAFMVVLILAGLGFIVWQSHVASGLEDSLPTAEQQLASVGALAEEVLALAEEIRTDDIANGKSGPFAYIEQQEVESRIGKKFNIPTPQNEKNAAEGYEDTMYRLTSALPDYDFTRQEIANFLIYVEGRTTRMKVTAIRLDRSTRKGATSDLWKPTFTITDRHPMKSG